MTTREQAMQWFNEKNAYDKSELSHKYYKDSVSYNYTSLTGREIEKIYKLEHLKKGVKVQYKGRLLEVLSDVGFIGQRGKMIPCVDDNNYIDDYCIDDLVLFSGEKENKTEENIYINRLKEQYKQMLSKKQGDFYLEGYNRLSQDYLAVRLFCLDTQLISFNDIEMLEFEVNQSLS